MCSQGVSVDCNTNTPVCGALIRESRTLNIPFSMVICYPLFKQEVSLVSY